jgi:signal transduction histidine kinase
MKLLADQKIRRLAGILAGLLAGFAALSAAMLGLRVPGAALYILLAGLCAGAAALAAVVRFLKVQSLLMDDAALQIQKFVAGDSGARIPCDEEGDLYRLFHEINSLACVLNAHAENEMSTKLFLKNTISDISHQLKTPLAALNIYNGILQQETDASPTLQKFTHLSELELDRIETLVQSLLKIARLDAGTIVLEQKEESVAEMMQAIRQHLAFRAQQEEKSLVLAGADDVLLLCDRTWLIEAIGNLVKNAMDHTRAGDTIRLEWQRFPAMVQIVVRDSGSGIRPEDLPYIFKRFYRSRFSSDTQGIGLGLPLAKAIVEAHGGTIGADSLPGAGAVFTVNFFIPTKL